MADGSIGQPVRRREDYRFLTGQGTYTDDINRPGPALRLSSCAARTPTRGSTAIDTSAAASAPGVVAVFTGKDMAADGIGGLPCGWLINSKDGSPMKEPPHPVLAVGPGAPCRRPGRGGDRRQPRPGARRRRADRGRLRGRAGRGRSGRGAEARRAAGLAGRGARAMSATTGISATSPRSMPRSARRRGSSSST